VKIQITSDLHHEMAQPPPYIFCTTTNLYRGTLGLSVPCSGQNTALIRCNCDALRRVDVETEMDPPAERGARRFSGQKMHGSINIEP
jgi:hypothetical protein